MGGGPSPLVGLIVLVGKPQRQLVRARRAGLDVMDPVHEIVAPGFREPGRSALGMGQGADRRDHCNLLLSERGVSEFTEQRKF